MKDSGVNELNGKHNRMNGFRRKIKLASNTLSLKYHEILNKAVPETCERKAREFCKALSYWGFGKARGLFLDRHGKGKERAGRMEWDGSHKEKMLRKQTLQLCCTVKKNVAKTKTLNLVI